MKLIKTLSLCLIMVLAGVNVSANKAAVSGEIPAKTVVIKAGNSDAGAYFSAASSVSFEIYKAGTPEDIQAIVKKIQGNKDVESASAGKVTGDYSMVNVKLKSAKDKAYWISLFKAAGLGHIRFNNNPVVETDQM
jgi:hypothetical protein